MTGPFPDVVMPPSGLTRTRLAMGLPPGPDMGRILKAVYERQLDGAVTTLGHLNLRAPLVGIAHAAGLRVNKGIVVNEPSIVAINKVNGRVEAVGKDAKDMLGRTPGNIVAIKPMKDGVIADFEVTEKMLTYFIKKAHNNRNVWVRPRIVIGVPSEITQVEKRAVKDSAYRAKASEVHLIEEAMAAAIGAGMPITEPAGNMIVDIGGGTTDIAVISLSGIVYSKAIRVAGNEMDEAIIQYIKRKYNLLIGERTAEEIKCRVGSAYPLDEELTMEVKGRDMVAGLPKTITVAANTDVSMPLENARPAPMTTSFFPAISMGRGILVVSVAPGSVTLPTDKFVEPSDSDFYLWGRLEGTAAPATGGSNQTK